MRRATVTTMVGGGLLAAVAWTAEPVDAQSGGEAATTGVDAQAWTMPPGYRDVQLATLESQRTFLHAMVDSMPEARFADVDNPGQRSFAEHVYHAAVVNAQAVARFLEGPPFEAPDPAAATLSRDGLEDAIDRSYAFMRTRLESQDDEARNATLQFAGRAIPAWQIWDELNEHTFWTLGEIVGNFRHAGMAPPAFRFY